MEKLLKGVLADPKKQEFETVEVAIKDYTTYYELLDCEIIDIISVKINGAHYDVILDDEGKINGKKDASMMLLYNGIPFDVVVGKCFVVKHDGKGNEKSLTDAECASVLASVHTYVKAKTFEKVKMLTASYN